jgi:hypothetical protein
MILRIPHPGWVGKLAFLHVDVINTTLWLQTKAWLYLRLLGRSNSSGLSLMCLRRWLNALWMAL